MDVRIVDYGMGNLASVQRAFEVCGARSVSIAEGPEALKEASHVVLPGVGSFADGMDQLRQGGWPQALQQTTKQGTPLLGICLGMQLLAGKGYEGRVTDGLGLIPGEVKLMQSHKQSEKIPQVGWNEVYPDPEDPLFAGVKPGTDFYFVHSYHFIPENQAAILGTTPYCQRIVSAVKREKVYGVQFHPEKSSSAGFQILKNFLTL